MGRKSNGVERTLCGEEAGATAVVMDACAVEHKVDLLFFDDVETRLYEAVRLWENELQARSADHRHR